MSLKKKEKYIILLFFHSNKYLKASIRFDSSKKNAGEVFAVFVILSQENRKPEQNFKK